MQLDTNVNLNKYHTFGISQTAHYLTTIQSVDDLIHIYQNKEWVNLPKLMLGKGSNVLFTAPFVGIVMINQMKGITSSSDDDYHYLHINGGEEWPSLVAWCVQNEIGGLENLALIPGCVGSAPIQNIGAYGVEFKDVCDFVDYLCLESLTVKRLYNAECEFNYRDSIFKKSLYGKAIVLAVGLKLAKKWKPNTHYGDLKSLDVATCSIYDIYEIICSTRQEKLPNPAQLGNAGSFFKNPIISIEHWKRLILQYPNLVSYPTDNGRKVAAGWLIDQCGLKGFTLGGAQVHPKQALVMVNVNQATSEDVVRLANHVCISVYDKFQIELEHEVRFFAEQNETNLKQILELRT